MSDTYLTLDIDPLAGSYNTFHMEGDQVTLREHQDVTAIIEANKAQYNLGRPKNEVRHVARIPDVIYNETTRRWRKNETSWEERQKEMKKFLNDKDNALFRTAPGEV